MIFMKRLPWWCVWRWTPLCLLRSWSQETSDWGIKTCSLSMKIIVRWQGAMMSTWLSWNIWRIWGQLREKRWNFIFIVWERGWGLPLCWQIFCWQCKKITFEQSITRCSRFLWQEKYFPLSVLSQISTAHPILLCCGYLKSSALLVFVTIQKRLVHINPI